MKCIIIVFFSLILASISYAQTSEEDFYKKGIELYESGDTGSALQVWIDAFNLIEDSSLIDPRIGSSFIEIVAKNKLSNLYQASTVIYYWSLSSTGKGDYENNLKNEVLKSEPIFDDFEFRRLKKELKDDPQKVAKTVLQKWQSLDPTPDSRINERLIEHWERIAYSKDNFTKASNTIFGTDDRAMLYIKYGKPQLIRRGTLEHNSGVIYSSVATVLNPTDKEVKKLLEDIFNSYYAADYEIWIYPFLSEKGRFVKVFGERYTTRSFQELEVITDFIPTYAFNRLRGVSTPGGIYTPGFFLLYNYISQLSNYDSFFSDQYMELNKILSFPSDQATARQINTDANWVFPQVRGSAADMNRIISDAPISESSYLKTLDDIDVKVKDYQYFDKDGKPIIFFVMNSYPLARMIDYMAKQKRQNLNDYLLTHTMTLLNTNEVNFGKLNDKPSVPVLSKSMVHPAQSIFKVSRINNRNTKFDFSVQVYDRLESYSPGEEILPKSLKAVGKKGGLEIEDKSVETKFDVSDIMIGYQFGESNIDDEIPFLVALDNKIPSSSNLFIHFQAINLLLNGDEKTILNLELSVKAKKSGLGIFNRSKINSVSFNYEDVSTQIRESLEFVLVDRKPGNYELTIKFLDQSSGERKSEKINFEIVSTE